MKIDIIKPYGHGYLDYASIEPSGLITLSGWYPETGLEQFGKPEVYLGDVNIPYRHSFRYHRPDIAQFLQVDNQFLGLSLNFLDINFNLPARTQHQFKVQVNGETLVEQNIEIGFSRPHYDPLLYTEAVAHREHIYGFGLPSPENPQEIVDLSQKCQGKTLDFGCGSGFLVKKLRERGLEAQGIELDRPDIQQVITEDMRSYITLYDGQFPLPFEDKSFDTVFTTEVIEHIPDYQAALQEIARISRQQLILTVPDMSAVPIGFFHGVVPWHLLESTHVNFFSQHSLEAVLSPYFAQIEFFKIAPVQVNNSRWYISLAAVCRQPKT